MTPHVAYNSGNQEWYTPGRFIDAARSVMLSIDLDPASTAEANEVVKAGTFYTKEEDGLSREWFGHVWLNPPYAAKLVSRFAVKLVNEYRNNHVTQAIVLVNNATETAWFALLAAEAMALCLPSGRISFWRPDGASKRPLQGSAFLYFGSYLGTDLFLDEFAQFGSVWRNNE